MRKLNLNLIIVLIGGLVLIVSLTIAGSLTPPGAPGSTMRTLDEIYNALGGTFDSSSINASTTGNLIQNLKYISNNLFWASSGNAIYNINSGNVGIGTIGPEAKLEIDTNFGETPLRVKQSLLVLGIETLRPNGAGDETNLEPYPDGGEENWEDVDDLPASPDDWDTDVYTGSGTYLRDLYIITDHSVGSGAIGPVTVYARCAVDSPGQLKIIIKTGGTVYESNEIDLTGSFVVYSQQWGTNPDTGLAWDWSEIDELQAGVALNDWSYCTQVYVEVSYAETTTETTFVINSSGNVGVGTATPGAKLDVAGSGIIGSGSSLATLILNKSGTATVGEPGKSSSKLILRGAGYSTAAFHIENVDTNGYAYHTSLQLDSSGYPVISYGDSVTGNLKLVHCNDADCSGGNESIVTVDDKWGISSTSLQLDSSGHPVIAYGDAMYFKLVHCNDDDCSGGDESVETIGNEDYNDYTSLQLDSSGYPVISYIHSNWPYIILVHCNDVNCSGGDESIEDIDTDGWSPYTFLQLDSSGYPVIAYVDGNTGYLKTVHCNDANCSDGDESIEEVDADGSFFDTSLQLDSSGYPVISYSDDNTGYLKTVHCNDANCSGSDESIEDVDTSGTAQYTSLQLDSSGYPVISYSDDNTGYLKRVHCNDANCSGGDESTEDVDTSGYAQDTSLQLDSLGYPVISYGDDDTGYLKLAKELPASFSQNLDFSFQNIVTDISNYRLTIKNNDDDELVTITSSGNVGIGTIDPASMLSVSGGTSIGSTYAGTAAPTNGLIIEGNVGIGTDLPGYNLDINGALRLYPSSAPTGANGVMYYDSGTNKFRCYQYGAWIDCAGSWTQSGSNLYPSNVAWNVGIGTANPQALLTIKGSSTASRWVALGRYTNSIAYSSDGITWTGLGTSIFSFEGRDAAWNGSMWVAVGGDTNSIAYSADGITWTGLGASIFNFGGYGVAWNGSMWVAVGRVNNSIAYSSDGINWTGLGTSIFSNAWDVAWNGSMWVAVGYGANSIAYSSDGINWTGVTGTSIFSNSWGGSVAWNGSMWVAVGSGNNSIAYSSDGINWTGLGKSIFTSSGYGVAWNGSMWVAVGGDANSIAYSSNGITWTGLGTSIFNSGGSGVAWNGSKWVALGKYNNSIAYSSDGINWTGLGTSIFTYWGTNVGSAPAPELIPAGPEMTFANLQQWQDFSGNPLVTIQDYTGNVGIGTTTPAYKLDINGALRLQPSSAPTGANGVMYYDSSTNKFRCYENGDWKDCIGTGGSSYWTQSGFNLYTSSTTWNVGIGTATPGRKLDIIGDASINGQLISSQEGGLYFGRSRISENQLAINPNSFGATWASTTGAGSRQWRSVSLSSDGKYQTATDVTGYIYTSSDYGVTWASTTGAGSRTWWSVSISSDGKYRTAVDSSGIYTSYDYGAIWVQRAVVYEPEGDLHSVSLSSDGKYQTAVNGYGRTGYIYTSSDYGATWASTTGAGLRYWYHVSISSDGKYQTAVVTPGYIYTSSDYGATWAERTGAGSRTWWSVSLSSDGKYQTAAAGNSYIYASSDYGVTWTARTGSGVAGWNSVSLSSDGKYQTAVTSYIYTSSDYGITWTQRTGAGSRNWWSVSLSSDGKYQTAVVSNGYIYTSSADSYIYGGNIGIGTTTPSSILDIYSSSTAVALTIRQAGTGNIADFRNATGSVFTIINNGSIGIGTTTPSYLLTVYAGATSTYGIAVHGSIKASGSIDPNTGLDISERYPIDIQCKELNTCPETGDVVSITENSIIKKSSVPYDQKLIGVISGNSAITMGGGLDATNSLPVALAGRVPIKVSTENGSITTGDLLTSASSTSGTAMKATGAGRVIGMALEPYSSEGTGSILIFINLHYSIGQLSEEGTFSLEEGQQTETTEQPTTLDQFTSTIKNSLEKLGLFLENGIARVKELVADMGKFKNLEVENKIQLHDQVTDDIYCTWIENGEWVKVKGECRVTNNEQSGSGSPLPSETPVPGESPETTPTPEPTSEPTPTLEPTPMPETTSTPTSEPNPEPTLTP